MAQLIKPSKYHRTIDGGELLRRREAIGLTQAMVACQCAEVMERQALSRVFICQLESAGEDGDWEHEVSVDFAHAIQKILSEECK